MKWKTETAQATLRKGFALFVLLFGIFLCKSQIYDDFSDINIDEGVEWNGDVGSFGVTGEGMLTLVGNESGRAYLSTAHYNVGDNKIEWHIRIKLNFAPSGNNYVRFYLTADRADLTDSELQGYYLQFGENQSNDAIELFYSDGKTTSSICRGTNGLINNSFDYNIKVIRDNDKWEIYVDNILSGEYILDYDCESDYKTEIGYFGIYCQFTTSNAGKFFFDDIYYGNLRIDTIVPKITGIKTTSSLNKIEVNFSEKATSSTALSPINYQIIETNGHPTECQYSQNCFDKVILTFQEEFTDRKTYHLRCSGIADHSNNISATDTLAFRFQKPRRNDLIISEIMADPTPSVGLPPVEYLELKNRTSRAISLSGWKLQIGNSIREFPNVTIDSGKYALVINSGSQSLFSQYDKLVPITILNITDAGQTLTLWSDFNEIIHSVIFKKDWHTESYKKDGGWSLEMIDTENPCGGKENWASSRATNGGTPCAENSVSEENPDITSPAIRKIAVINSTTLILYFTETVHLNPEMPQIKIDNATIGYTKEIEPDAAAWEIGLMYPLTSGKTYILSVQDSICDCAGQPVNLWSQIQFCLPERPIYGDIVINEILSDPPETSDADFIEIYNRSSKAISLKDLRIGSGGDEYPLKSCVVDNEGMIIYPKSYIAICKDRGLTEEQYYCPFPDNLLGCDSLPSFSNEQGIIHLTDYEYNRIDKVIYDEEMHYKMLKTTDGVSLEKIHTDAQGLDAENWKSAAESAGFATPGYKNSQWSDEKTSDKRLQIVPEIFSPDNDGFDDYTEILCQFVEPENRVSVIIYNRHGGIVKTLVNNELCGTEVKYVWDGVAESGTLARPDIYIVKMQYWTLSGQSKSYKKTVSIARKKGAVY